MPGSDASGAAKAALRWGIAAAAAVLLFAVPVPYVLYEPGVVVPVDGLVTVDKTNRQDPRLKPDQPDLRAPSHGDVQGEWLLTTVYLEPRATLWSVVKSAWQADREAYTKKSVFQGGSAEEYKARMDVLMAESQSKAAEAAFRLAGVRYESEPVGVYVARGAGPLKAGDRIAAVDGADVDGLAALTDALRSRAGREAELTVQRGGTETAVRLAVDGADAETPADMLGGAELTEIIAVRPATETAVRLAVDGADAETPADMLGGAELTEIIAVRPADPAVSVTIDAGQFGGPSAGLVLALHIYERLTGESLTGGRRIAATGTIGPSGEIGAVGGIKLKAIAASRAGADLFLVPEESAAAAAAAAEAAGGGMAVAGVNTLEEAVRLLRNYGDQEGRTMIGGS